VELESCARKGRSAITWLYRWKAKFPVFHLTCITHRQDPIYLTTIVGAAAARGLFIGHAIERVFYR